MNKMRKSLHEREQLPKKWNIRQARARKVVNLQCFSGLHVHGFSAKSAKTDKIEKMGNETYQLGSLVIRCFQANER